MSAKAVQLCCQLVYCLDYLQFCRRRNVLLSGMRPHQSQHEGWYQLLKYKLLKDASDTNLMGLICDGDQVDHLVTTVEMIIDFRKYKAPPLHPHHPAGLPGLHSGVHCHPAPEVGAEHGFHHPEIPAGDVESSKDDDERISTRSSSVILTSSILTSSITIWYSAATTEGKGILQCIIHSAENCDWLAPSIP
ncbi:uncharacterized protein ACNS7B_011003 [Menidia menidia]